MLKFTPATELELKAVGENLPDGYVAGWASTPDLDSYKHVVKTGAFDESIVKKGLTGPKGIKFLVNHDWRKVAGVIKVLKTVGERLWIEAQFNLNISYARDAYEAAKMNGGLNFSVGFMLEDYSFKGKDAEEHLEITKGELFEVSVVSFPGNEEATMDYVKSKEADEPKSIAEFEKALVAMGLVKSRNDAQKITLAVKAHAHLFGSGDPPQDDAPVVNPPSITLDKLNQVSDLVAKMRNVISS
jgi:HK97 family phage prohead protease